MSASLWRLRQPGSAPSVFESLEDGMTFAGRPFVGCETEWREHRLKGEHWWSLWKGCGGAWAPVHVRLFEIPGY